MKISLIIPAKGNSERLQNKNLLKIKGKSLVYLACEKCLNVNIIDNVYLDTESEKIIEDVAPLIDKGLKIIKRPAEMASNSFSGNDLIKFEHSKIEKSDLILHTYSTSPLLTAETIQNVIIKFLENIKEYDSFFTAVHFREYIWKNGIPLNFDPKELPNSFDLDQNVCVETHGLYGITDSALTRLGTRLGDKVLPVMISRDEALDINTEIDFKLLEVLWN